MYQVKLEEASIRLVDLVDEAIKGKKVFILRDTHQMVQLVPVKSPLRRPQFGSAEGLVMMADDFDAPLEDFSEYMP